MLRVSNLSGFNAFTPPAAGGLTNVIDEDFSSGDLSAWDLTETGWFNPSSTIRNNDTTNFTNYVAFHATEAAADCYVLVELQDLGSSSQQGMGVTLRSAASSTKAEHYQIHVTSGGTQVKWDIHDNTGAFTSSPQTGNAPGNWNDGTWLGVHITGTGASTVIDIWQFSSDPGDPDTWGSADVSFTNDPGGDAVDSGNFVGVRCYTAGNQYGSIDLDNFKAWTGTA